MRILKRRNKNRGFTGRSKMTAFFRQSEYSAVKVLVIFS
nr:MAG TPA: hypothetical protein [Caudoviricetes sp.]